VPELPEVESVRRRIAPSMVRARIENVDVRRPDLRRAFPDRFAERLTGQRVVALTRRAKYLLASLSSGETLLMHLGMSGWFRVERDGRAVRTGTDAATGEPPRAALDPHDHVVFHMSSGKAVVFNDPRRFGMMDLTPTPDVDAHPALSGLGPEPLSADFDAASLARACRGKKTSLKAALLDQRVVAGLGNIYASEALHVAGLSPSRRASTLATRTGAPREAAHRLAAAIKRVLESAVARQTAPVYRDSRFLVYDREDEGCRKRKCNGTIRRRTQGGRSTFYCSVCQR
jgi:formamidopyrimidine-DNA glycosylase